MKNRLLIFLIFIFLFAGCEMQFDKSIFLNDVSIPINGNNVIETYTEIYTDFDAVQGDIVLNDVVLTFDINNPGSVDDELELWISKTGHATKNYPYTYLSEPSYTSDPNLSINITETPIIVKAGQTKTISIKITNQQALNLISQIMATGEIYILFKNKFNSVLSLNFYLHVINPTITVNGVVSFSLINPIF